MQDDRVGRKPGQRSTPDPEHIGEEPGGTGEGDDVADPRSRVHRGDQGARYR